MRSRVTTAHKAAHCPANTQLVQSWLGRLVGGRLRTDSLCSTGGGRGSLAAAGGNAGHQRRASCRHGCSRGQGWKDQGGGLCPQHPGQEELQSGAHMCPGAAAAQAPPPSPESPAGPCPDPCPWPTAHGQPRPHRLPPRRTGHAACPSSPKNRACLRQHSRTHRHTCVHTRAQEGAGGRVGRRGQTTAGRSGRTAPRLLSSLSPCNSSASLKLSPNESFFTKEKKKSWCGGKGHYTTVQVREKPSGQPRAPEAHRASSTWCGSGLSTGS